MPKTVRHEYEFANYSFQTAERAAAARDAISAMAADGWRMHSVSMSFVEVAVMWEREVTAA